MKGKQACNSKRKAEEKVAQARTNQRRLDSHAVVIVLDATTVEALEGETPWATALLKKLGMKALMDLIVRKGAKPKPKCKKADFVL